MAGKAAAEAAKGPISPRTRESSPGKTGRTPPPPHPALKFNSLSFLAFFAIVLAVHGSRVSWQTKKANLLLASYLFYAAWNPPFVALLWISTAGDWYVARAIAHAGTRTAKRLLLLISLTTNLGLLAYFKYGGFLMDGLVSGLAVLGVEYTPPGGSIILPVGISFYTFQTLSYTIDVYRGDHEPWKSKLDFALFVTFFPQLVAGPIVRAFDFLPQCATERRASRRQFGWGVSLLLIGLFEKTVVADALLAPVADQVYTPGLALTMVDAWVGTLAFAGQIFADFAGYSTCAIGAAMCLGFAIPDNFRFPYAAVGFSDFWRRWHISLSTWLRDYLYISLGGNRRGPIRTRYNLLLTMVLGGLWHGAAWTFVVWGALHGIYLILERVVCRLLRNWEGRKAPASQVLGAMVTFVLVCIAWVFFRAPDFTTAHDIFDSMFTGELGTSVVNGSTAAKVAGVMGTMLGIHWMLRNTTLEAAAARLPWWVVSFLFAAMGFAILTMTGDDHAFIYFQF
jgi:alginate O-acetyltransferase complex protein AlgI